MARCGAAAAGEDAAPLEVAVRRKSKTVIFWRLLYRLTVIGALAYIVAAGRADTPFKVAFVIVWSISSAIDLAVVVAAAWPHMLNEVSE